MLERKITKLVDRLGMANDINPLINSEEDYDRFGKVVLNILESYRENPPQVRVFRRICKGIDRECVLYFIKKPQRETYAKMIENFKMYYGIDVEKPMKKAEISRHDKVSKQLIAVRLKYVLAVLYMHKQDIWYDML